ncbi:hypothetical protein [Cellulosimicrobium funkei]|uniref:hypothetical protein n=1 Tax=Cellulosimicrobium funkei TaxID=264251 RepID=UPI001E65D5EF|nr:hypothetical protein [Cellulosimicrobium funkei]
MQVGDVAERDGQRRDLGDHRATPRAGPTVAGVRRVVRRAVGSGPTVAPAVVLAVVRGGAGRTCEAREVVLPDPVGQGGQPRRRRRAQAGPLRDVAGRGHDPAKAVVSGPGCSRAGRAAVVGRGGSAGEASCDSPRGSAARTRRRGARRRPDPGALHRERRFGTTAQDEPPRGRRRDERRER